MKKTTNKTGRKRTKKVSRGPRTHKPVDLAAIRKEITGLVGNEAISMVETTMAEVEKGHYTAMKFLFEMIGLYPATGAEEAVGLESVASRLVRRLGIPEESKLETEVTKDSPAGQMTVSGDAVE